MKVAFSGGRDRRWTAEERALAIHITMTCGGHPIVGDCKTGIDKDVRECFRIPLEESYRADWDTHGKAAGPLRNQAMIDDADMLVAFPGHGASRGTRDCILRAKFKGLPVIVFEPGRR